MYASTKLIKPYSLKNTIENFYVTNDIDYNSGVFALVKKSKSNKNYVSKYCFDDNGYETFLLFYAQNNKNKHLPKIKTIVKNDNLIYTKMEKLVPIDDRSALYYFFDNNMWSHLNLIISGRIEAFTVKSFIEYVEQNNSDYYDCLIPISLFKILTDIINFIINSNRSAIDLDIHGENVMQREDGTIVITDPFCGF